MQFVISSSISRQFFNVVFVAQLNFIICLYNYCFNDFYASSSLYIKSITWILCLLVIYPYLDVCFSDVSNKSFFGR